MRAKKFVAFLGLVSALKLCVTDTTLGASQDKEQSVNRSVRAATKMSATGQENTNAKWSADPDHGWVRAEERHQAQQSKKDAGDSRQIRGKQKQKGKTPQAIKH